MKKRISTISLSLLSSALLWGCAAQTTDVQTPQTLPQEETMSINALPIPVIGEAKLFQHPRVLEFTTQNGLSVWYYHNPLVPLMSMRVQFDNGATLDPLGKSGLVNACFAMLKEGAGGMDAQQFSDAIEILGASLYSSASQDSGALELQVMSSHFEAGLKLLEVAWFEAHLDEKDFARLKRIWLNRLSQRSDSPESIAKIAGNLDYFGPQNPYAHPVDGYTKSVETINIDEVKEVYEKMIPRKGAVITAVGSIPPEAFITLLDEGIGSRELSDALERASLKGIEKRDKQTLTIVDKPGAAQSVIRIALPAPTISDPMHLPYKLLNIPFGGTFTSRLMQNIREDKGYSYGAYAAMAPLKQDGFFISQSSVASEVTGPALQEFIKELNSFREGNFTADELARAKATWQAELVQSFETQGSALSVLASMHASKQTDDYLNAFTRSLQELDIDTFNTWAKEIAPLSIASITIVGDKDIIIEQTKDLGLPTPIIRNADGEIIP